jgi:hypothetical protein
MIESPSNLNTHIHNARQAALNNELEGVSRSNANPHLPSHTKGENGQRPTCRLAPNTGVAGTGNLKIIMIA